MEIRTVHYLLPCAEVTECPKDVTVGFILKWQNPRLL